MPCGQAACPSLSTSTPASLRASDLSLLLNVQLVGGPQSGPCLHYPSGFPHHVGPHSPMTIIYSRQTVQGKVWEASPLSGWAPHTAAAPAPAPAVTSFLRGNSVVHMLKETTQNKTNPPLLKNPLALPLHKTHPPKYYLRFIYMNNYHQGQTYYSSSS